MLSEELNKLIEAALIDGIITEKERSVIKKRAIAEGVDPDEIDILLDAELHKINTAAKTTSIPSKSDSSELFDQLSVEINRINSKYQSKNDSYEIRRKRKEEIADVIKNLKVPSSRNGLLDYISIMESKWLHTSSSDEDEIKTAYKMKFKEALAKARRLYADDNDFQKLIKKEKSLKKLFSYNRYSDIQAFGCVYGLIMGLVLMIVAVVSLYSEVNNGNFKFNKIFKFGGYDSYQEAARAYDFVAAHKILDELQEDFLSEKSSYKREKKKDVYDRACDDLFKSEALYLCAKGDKESIDRVVFLLSELPIEGNALPEGTKYENDLDFGFHSDDNSQYNQHNLYIKSVRRFNQACNTLVDLSIAQHNYSLAEKVLPLFKSIPFPIEDFETDVEASKKAGKTIYKRHEMKYSWKEKESAIEKINKAIDDGVFSDVTNHIK